MGKSLKMTDKPAPSGNNSHREESDQDILQINNDGNQFSSESSGDSSNTIQAANEVSQFFDELYQRDLDRDYTFATPSVPPPSYHATTFYSPPPSAPRYDPQSRTMAPRRAGPACANKTFGPSSDDNLANRTFAPPSASYIPEENGYMETPKSANKNKKRKVADCSFEELGNEPLDHLVGLIIHPKLNHGVKTGSLLALLTLLESRQYTGPAVKALERRDFCQTLGELLSHCMSTKSESLKTIIALLKIIPQINPAAKENINNYCGENLKIMTDQLAILSAAKDALSSLTL